MSTKHTPGPWEAIGVTVLHNRTTVADCEPYNTTRSTDTCIANARLCAAAPDLLYALRGMIDVVNQDSSARERVVAKRRARRAIAKAEGK